MDFLDISYGFNGEDEPVAPPDFPYKDVIYGAGEIKKQVGIPVFAVNSIRSAEDAEGVLRETGVDMVDIGRGVLVNYDWAKDAAAGGIPGAAWTAKPASGGSIRPNARGGFSMNAAGRKRNDLQGKGGC